MYYNLITIVDPISVRKGEGSIKGSFKNDVTMIMPKFGLPSPYVAVSHFFHYTLSPPKSLGK